MAERENGNRALTSRRKTLKLIAGTAAGVWTAGAGMQIAKAATSPVEIRLYDYKLTEQGANVVLKKLVADFQRKYPWITVKLEPVSWPDHLKKLVIRVQGATPPDVVRLSDADVFPLAGMGALSPIGQWLEKDGAASALRQIPDSVRKSLQVRGADVFVPATATGMDVLAWNMENYKAAGLDPLRPPKTWDQLVEYAKKLTDPSKDRFGWAIVSDRSGSASRRVIRWIVSAGGEIFSPDGTELVANSPAALRGYEFWADLALKYKVVPPGSINVSIRDVMGMYGQSKIGMYDCGPNTVMIGNNDFPGNAARTHMGPMPDPWRPPLLCGGFAVMSGSKHQEASALLVSWLTSANSQVEYSIGSYEVPIRADAASDPRLKQHPLLEQAAALTSRGIPNPALHEKYAEIEDKLFDAIQSTLSGSKTPKQALDDAVAQGNQILKNWKPKFTRS